MRVFVHLHRNTNFSLKLTWLNQNENGSAQFGSDLPDQA
jgi:hypothetical protein